MAGADSRRGRHGGASEFDPLSLLVQQSAEVLAAAALTFPDPSQSTLRARRVRDRLGLAGSPRGSLSAQSPKNDIMDAGEKRKARRMTPAQRVPNPHGQACTSCSNYLSKTWYDTFKSIKKTLRHGAAAR